MPFMNVQSVFRVGIVGVGHFGRLHAVKVAQHPKETLIGVHDPDIKRARAVARDVGCRVFESYEALLEQVDAVVIATPAESHYALGLAALETGRHVLVEKPIAASVEEGHALAAKAAQCSCVLQVGHLLRYSAEHRAITERITQPVYIEATRIAPFKIRGTDVSVVLDLMIHDLDLVLAIVDSPIASIDALGVAVSSPHDDIANARVRFENGCVATITASRVSLKTERRMRLFGKEGYLSADFMARELSFINRSHGLPLLGTGGFSREAIKWKDHDNLTAEHDAFVASCLHGAPVLVDAQAGLRALEAALRVAEEIRLSQALMKSSGLMD
ncbi:oxidoreductase [Saccharibacter floricola DSM 15669]|uniref:Oxidoreductase n=2 Tax=Saccharibacter TaxID=231052 RepID=A0ABQ0P4S6_9PROT|nr:oxidoreductase [Saccharibacter floricola DSM 15669]